MLLASLEKRPDIAETLHGSLERMLASAKIPRWPSIARSAF